jgi:hypothetical protein
MMIRNYRRDAYASPNARYASPVTPLKYNDNDAVTHCDALMKRYGSMGFYSIYRKLGSQCVTASSLGCHGKQINDLAGDAVKLPLSSFVEVHHG